MEKVFLTKRINDCLIVLPGDHSITEQTAAEEVQSYLEKALGIKYAIVPEQDAKGKCIYVGKTDFAKNAGIFGKSIENWIIAMHDGSLILTGGDGQYDRGIIYAAYHFLEDFVGVRWWNPQEEDVLILDELALDEDLYREGTPCFTYRKPFLHFSIGPEGFPYLARTRTNAISPFWDEEIPDQNYDETVRRYGGARQMGRPHHAHTLGKYFSPEEYFDEHPDWWAWNKRQGKRMRTGSYCFANEEFFQTLLKKVLAFIEEDVALAKKTGVELPCCYAVSLDDINKDFFCECDECVKVMEESGDTGYMLRFVNRVAREVAKVYPFAKILTSAYANCIEPPKDGTIPEKNMVIYLADLFSDMARGIHAPTNTDYLRLVTTWADICKKAGCELYMYDYLYSARTNYPLPLFYRLKDTIPTCRDVGATGFFIETQSSTADCWELNKYILTHLLEDPDTDADSLIADFVNRYYGKAAKCVKEYLELLKSALDKNMMTVLCCGEDSRFNYVDSTTAIKGSELLFEAMALVKGEAPYEERVSWLRKPLDAVILFKFFELKKQAVERGEDFNFDIAQVKARLIQIIKAHMETPYGAPAKAALNSEIEYFSEIAEEEMVFDIPEAFSDVAEEDICQVTLLNMPKYSQKRIQVRYGYSAVSDPDSVLPLVMKLSYDSATASHIPYAMAPTFSTDEVKVPLLFRLQNDGVDMISKELYKDTIVPGKYHLYKMGSLSDMKNSPNIRFTLPAGAGSINISGLTATFPMDACDVYLSMKFTGAVYGGNPEEENAIYFERMIVVRK